MNTDRKNFTGRLNSDIDERLFSLDKFRGDYSDAYNCLILSAIDSGIGLVKGFKGTTEVTTSYATVAAKKVIGKCVIYLTIKYIILLVVRLVHLTTQFMK